MNIPYADLELATELKRHGLGPEAVSKAWLGELLQPSHKLLYRRNDLDPPDRWFLGLGYFEGSVACVWLGTLRSVPSSPDLKYFELDVSWEQPLFKAVVDVKSPHARAYSMKFRSP